MTPDEPISEECIVASSDHGQELFEILVDDFDNMENEGLDPLAVVFSLWVSSACLLLKSGWTEKDLQEQLAFYANKCDVEGHA